MKVLKNIDLFGQKITFRVFNGNRFHTYISVFLTLILMISSCIFAYFQGLEFIFHNESKTLQSRRVNKDFEFTKLPLNDFFLAWQIQDELGNNINFSNILYPHFFYSSYKNSDEILIDHDKCNKFQKINLLENLPKDAQNFYCSDISNLTIGGGWENDNMIEYFYLLIELCDNGKCTTKNDLEMYLNSGDIYLVLYYPSVSFLPEEKIPYQITYNKLSILLNNDLLRYDRFYIEKNIIVDDKGWLLPSYKTKILYDVSEIETNYYIQKTNLSNALSFSDNVQIYSVIFYLSQKNTYYKRWFTKAFESFTVIATFFKIIFVVFKLISRICNDFIFYGLIIDYNTSDNKKNGTYDISTYFQKSKSIISFKSKFNNLHIQKVFQKNNNDSENKKENNLSEIKDVSSSSLVDKRKFRNRLKSLNQSENFIKLRKNENKNNNKNDSIINIIKNNLNDDNNIINVGSSKLNIRKKKNSKKFNSVLLRMNPTQDIDGKINQMLKKINNVYKLFFRYIFYRSKGIKTSFNIYKISRKILENKMDVISYLKLIEIANNLRIAK